MRPEGWCETTEVKGIQKVHIENARASFDFQLHRNITVVRGKSASGKTTLCEMVADHVRRAEQSGIRITSSHPCTTLFSPDWESELERIQDSIIFIDEGAKYICSEAFARALQHSSNYFVLFTRENLYELPYGATEIYEIAMVGRSRKSTTSGLCIPLMSGISCKVTEVSQVRRSMCC